MRTEDWKPTGGEWNGLLFANPAIGLPPRLTWCFEVALEDSRKLTVDWMPASARSWRGMAGQRLTCARFSEPAEASVYHFMHHRYDEVALHLTEQRERAVRAAITIAGDLDGLGAGSIHVQEWLTFSGILVSLPGVGPDAALARLGEFTDTSDLVLDPDSGDAAPRFLARGAS